MIVTLIFFSPQLWLCFVKLIMLSENNFTVIFFFLGVGGVSVQTFFLLILLDKYAENYYKTDMIEKNNRKQSQFSLIFQFYSIQLLSLEFWQYFSILINSL